MKIEVRLSSLGAALVLGVAMLGATTTAYAAAGGNGPTVVADPPGKANGVGKHQETTPQPISTADANGAGANGGCPGGPYCSTTDGSPSQNGNGGGKATGKPCAGCVGKADNKNPKGQLPGGSDHNAGYECDSNHGVGKGNPAHSSCTPAEPTTNPTPEPTPDPTPTRDPVPTKHDPKTKTVKVLGIELERAPQALAPTAVLPNTGAPVSAPLIGAAGLGLLLAGAAAVRRSFAR